MGRPLPTGTITFLFTDIEGSTRLLAQMGTDAYAVALGEHRRAFRDAFAAHGGVEVGTDGDAFFVVFEDAAAALDAAEDAQRSIASAPYRVRMGVHTGTARIADDDYVGADIHLAARIASAAHGGQILVSEATAASVAPSLLTDLGLHRMKDFPDAIRIFQVGDTPHPPPRTVSSTNLPHPARRLVGRVRELAEVGELVRTGSRLVTLTGPGGSGKTRLAVEAATDLLPEFPGGVFWVSLAPLREADLVLSTIAGVLGARDGLAEHIADRRLLILIDNMEHVISAAVDVAQLVETCPRLHLMITSRELLRVRGETEYPVEPLSDETAVDFFCTVSGVAADPSVTELCRALDNLPLAIELAAARASILSPSQIMERLSGRLDLLKGRRDSETRQQTLRATIDWSYQLLTAEERRLFEQFSGFRGGARLDAVERVTDADLDALQSLVDKSLVRRSGDRFLMLETIRAYAEERLAAGGEGEAMRRHADHYLDLAERAYPHLRGSPKEWLEVLDSEHDNLRAALDHLESAGETRSLLRLAGALWKFWSMKGHIAEGLRRLDVALAVDTGDSEARAIALAGAVAFSLAAGDRESAFDRGEEALDLSRRLGLPWHEANALLLLGNVYAESGQLSEAEGLFTASLRMFQRLDDDHYVLLATRLIAWMAYDMGDRDRAASLHESVVAHARVLGNQRMEATSLGALGEYAIEAGDVRRAIPLLEASSRIYADLGEAIDVATNLCRFARALALSDAYEQATVVLASAIASYEQMGARPPSFVGVMNDATMTAVEAHLDQSTFQSAWNRGVTLPTAGSFELALRTLK